MNVLSSAHAVLGDARKKTTNWRPKKMHNANEQMHKNRNDAKQWEKDFLSLKEIHTERTQNWNKKLIHTLRIQTIATACSHNVTLLRLYWSVDVDFVFGSAIIGATERANARTHTQNRRNDDDGKRSFGNKEMTIQTHTPMLWLCVVSVDDDHGAVSRLQRSFGRVSVCTTE